MLVKLLADLIVSRRRDRERFVARLQQERLVQASLKQFIMLALYRAGGEIHFDPNAVNVLPPEAELSVLHRCTSADCPIPNDATRLCITLKLLLPMRNGR